MNNQDISTFMRAQEWVGLLGGGLALLVAFIQASRWAMSHRLWPDRYKDEWHAECRPAERNEEHYGEERLDPNRAWNKRLGDRWSQMREMRVNDYFKLKLGKARVIESIWLEDNGDGYPEQYKLMVKEPSGKHFTEKGTYKGPIDIKFEKPIKIEGFSVEIATPKMTPKNDKGQPPAWSIFDIKITEVRLFGKYWRKIIL